MRGVKMEDKEEKGEEGRNKVKREGDGRIKHKNKKLHKKT